MTEVSKSPARSAEKITKDIAVERVALASAMDALRDALQQMTDTVAEKTKAAAHTALVVAPAAAVAAGSLIGAAAHASPASSAFTMKRSSRRSRNS